MTIRKHYYISGRVQGVGFRYRAYYVARSYGLTGYARNLSDGRVEIEVQGQKELVRDFLDRVEDGRFIHIENMESYDMEVDEMETGFYTE